MTEAAQQPAQNQSYKMVNATVSNKRVYMRNRDMAEFEKELETSRLAAENAANPQPSDQPANTENPNPSNEPQSNVDWQKRYSDIQSDRDKKLADANKVINEERKLRLDAENKLKETSQTQKRYPTSEKELEEWCKEFPPLLPIIQTIALKAFETEKSEILEEIKEVKQFQKAYANEKGRIELLKIHPDANEVEKDPRFATWFNEQESEIQQLINTGDPKKIGKAISLYKKDLGIVTKTSKDFQKEASTAINLGPTPPNMPKEQRTWYESEVNKMSSRVYAQNEKEIELARVQGRYVYDISRS